MKEFTYCGRKWGVVYCDEDTPCYECRKNRERCKKFKPKNHSPKPKNWLGADFKEEVFDPIVNHGSDDTKMILNDTNGEDDVCQDPKCGHKKNEHWKEKGMCLMQDCKCKKFKAKETRR